MTIRLSPALGQPDDDAHGVPARPYRVRHVTVLPAPTVEPPLEPLGCAHSHSPREWNAPRVTGEPLWSPARVERSDSHAVPPHDLMGYRPMPDRQAAREAHTGRPTEQGRPSGSVVDPDVTTAAHVADVQLVVRGVAETVLGHRPVAQLRRWTSREVYRMLAEHPVRDRRRRFGVNATIRRLGAVFPADDAAEAMAIVEDGPRVRAIAVRCDRLARAKQPRWVCTDLRVG
jgi:hypothetical protein